MDDSIVRVMLDRELVCGGPAVMRRCRSSCNSSTRQLSNRSSLILAVGAHLKNTVALSVGPQVFISQHIGDLETDQAYWAFRRVIADFENLYEASPQIVAADLHPDYLSTKFAGGRAREIGKQAGRRSHFQVQHHIAHVLSCMAENESRRPRSAFRGTARVTELDGTVWGGEFFLVTDEVVERVAHLRPFRLPGGDRAVKEPRRTALGLLHEMFGDKVFEQEKLATVAAFSPAELALLKTMLAKNLNSPVTTSVGRLFDAVASLIDLRQQIRFEGQAAMELEFALDGASNGEAYPLPIENAVTKQMIHRASRIRIAFSTGRRCSGNPRRR